MKIFPELLEIKRLRNKLDISQENLAHQVGLTQSTITRIEKGEVDPPYSKVKKIFEYLESEKLKRKELKKKAETIMTRQIKLISPSTKIKKAIELMNEYNISQLPILDANKNVGSISSKKIQKIIIESPDLLNAHVDIVKELPFPEVKKDWDIKDISNLLLNYSAILVKEFGEYIGIITNADLLKIV